MTALVAYRRALAAEWLRWRSVRSTWAITALAVLVTGMTSALLAATELSPDLAESTVAYAMVCLAGVLPIGLVPTLIAVGGVLASGQDDRYQLSQPAWLVIPRRGAIAAARMSVLGAWGAAVSLAAMVVGYAVAALWPSTSMEVAWSAGLGSLALRYVILCALSGVLGAALAGAMRGTTLAIATLVVVPLIVESALAAALRETGIDGVGRYFPFTASQTFVTAPGTPVVGLDPWAGGLVFGLWVGLAAVAWLVGLRRRDL